MEISSLPELQQKINAFLRQAKESELIFSHPRFFQCGATGFLDDFIRNGVRDGKSVILVTPHWLNTGKVLVRLDFDEPEAAETTCFMERIQDLRQLDFSGLTMLRMNNFWCSGSYFGKNVLDLDILQKLMDLILEIHRKTNSRFSYFFHDFLSICPRFFLLDRCFCRPDISTAHCAECLKRNAFALNHAVPNTDVRRWRELFRRFLSECTELVFFSLSTLNLVEKALPGVVMEAPERCRFMRQEVDLAEYTPLEPAVSDAMTIGIVGGITPIKGVVQVLELANYLETREPSARIVIAGTLEARSWPSNVTVTGRYRRQELPELLRRHGVNVIFFSSIWPETYSRVIQEVKTLRLPIALYDLGAPAERMKFYPDAAFIPDFTPQAAYTVIRALFERTTMRRKHEDACPETAAWTLSNIPDDVTITV